MIWCLDGAPGVCADSPHYTAFRPRRQCTGRGTAPSHYLASEPAEATRWRVWSTTFQSIA